MMDNLIATPLRSSSVSPMVALEVAGVEGEAVSVVALCPSCQELLKVSLPDCREDESFCAMG